MRSKLIQVKARGVDWSKMTPNQRLFVEELLADPKFNATDAARRAGYGGDPSVAANKLLKSKLVRAAIGKVIGERMKEVQIRQEDVLLELARIAFFDPGDLYEDDGTLKPIHEIDENARRVIASLDVKSTEYATEEGTAVTIDAKVKTSSKLEALKLLGQHLGMFQERVKVDMEHSADKNLLRNIFAQLGEPNGQIVDAKAIERTVENE